MQGQTVRYCPARCRILDISENIIPGTKFLWLNKFVKYRNKPVFYEEFFEAGIYDLYQLKKPNNDLFSYDEIAINYLWYVV